MSFAKPVKNESFEDFDQGICSVPGCGARWSVKIDAPKCSYHQWGTTSNPKPVASKLPDLKAKSVSQWYDEKDPF